MTLRPLTLRELPAPPGWTVVLLEHVLPVEDAGTRERYRDASAFLLERLRVALDQDRQELLLHFDRCRPGREIVTLQEHARVWMPEFGVGVWIDQEPPKTWTREELLDTPPGTLRPVIERVVRIKPETRVQRMAEQQMLGSGVLIWAWGQPKADTLKLTTGFLLPTITDPSLTSFPFYLPLLRGDRLRQPSEAYRFPFEEVLPQVSAYARESCEDGGLLLLVRQPPARFLATLTGTAVPFQIQQISLSQDIS